MDDHSQEAGNVMTISKPVIGLYVTRSRGQWVIRDPNGDFWIIPPTEDPWDQREPYDLTDGADLEPVPGHYRYMLKLPF